MQLQKERVENPKLYRFFEMMPGLIVWGSLIWVVWWSFTRPVFVMIFSILFSSYWVSMALRQAIGVFWSYKKIAKNHKIDWLERARNFNKSDVLLKNSKGLRKKERKMLKKDAKKLKILKKNGEKLIDFEEIYHVVMLANYEEPEEIIRPSVEAILNSNYPNKKIIIVLANEARADEKTREHAEKLKKEFGHKVFAFLRTVHPDIPGEVKAKGANFNYAARELEKFLVEKNIDYDNILVSAFDGDTRAAKEYFGRLTYLYLSSKDRHLKSFQPVPFYFNNIWNAPWFSRATAFGTSFFFMMEAGLGSELPFTYSGHATSFSGAVRNGYWSVDCINEDSKQGFKAFLNERGKHVVVPMFTPIFMDAVLSGDVKSTAKNQYKQLQRWAYGAEHLPYLFTRFAKEKELRTMRVFARIMRYLKDNLMWGASVFLVFISTTLPMIVHPEIRTTLLGVNYRTLFLWVWNFGTFATVTYFFVSVLLSKKFKVRHGMSSTKFAITAVSQWALFPFSIIVFSGLTGLDSITRLLFGRYLTYWTTVKVKAE